MSELKTKPTEVPVADFIAAIDNPVRRADAEAMHALLTDITGQPAEMWGPAIVGYGRYTYVGSNKKPGEWMVIGFSPRKANLTVYIMPGFKERPDLMERLGKFKTSVSCLNINRLADVDTGVLRELCEWSVAEMKTRDLAG